MSSLASSSASSPAGWAKSAPPVTDTPSSGHRLLASYFRSGWAFFIPYLAAYLLYAWLRWPVNPGVGGEGLVKVASESAGTSSSLLPSPSSLLPSLLHVYWALHGIHLILGGITLCSWWKDQTPRLQLSSSTGALSTRLPATHYPLLSLLPSPFSLLQTAAPWILLGLLFWIPGIYLEWPSDPWEHLRRINEWHILGTVTAHSAWMKSSYFLPYSLTGHTSGLSQLNWLNYYYTGICLLLSWQYYRLARAVGLGERASFVFVLLNAVTFGNNIFSFYRYYGLSSSIFAQLGAVALTRIALEALGNAKAEQGAKGKGQESYPTSGHRSPVTAHSPPPTVYWLLPSVTALLALTAFNHPQGLGIAGLGVLAVVVWRLIEWKRIMAFWLTLAAVLASVVVVLWFPRYPALDEIYRPQGWLTTWYGFNLFAPTSPAFSRAAHILGSFGIINLLLALWFVVRRNHIAGWLTLMPVIALILPCFALPFAHLLATTTSVENIITFHRMFLAIPAGLALVGAFGALMPTSTATASDGAPTYASPPVTLPRNVRRYCSLIVMTAGLLLLSGLSPDSPAYSRFWHSLQCTPDDLQLRHMVEPWTHRPIIQPGDESILMIDTLLGSEVYECFVPTFSLSTFRDIHAALDNRELERRLDWLRPPWIAEEPDTQETPFVIDFSTPDAAWVTLAGAPHMHETLNETQIISNSPGDTTEVFSSGFIPVSLGQRYHLTSSVRQARGDPTTNYLAVAWYDREKRFLPSAKPPPNGAGAPAGWSNGTYSYYGLTGQSAPAKWTPYTITFGARTPADIPANAAYIKVGALLNYHVTTAAQVQLAKAQLQTCLIRQCLVWLPPMQRLYSSASLAGYLSGHWPVQRVAVDHVGTAELLHLVSQRPAASFPPYRAFPPAD